MVLLLFPKSKAAKLYDQKSGLNHSGNWLLLLSNVVAINWIIALSEQKNHPLINAEIVVDSTQ